MFLILESVKHNWALIVLRKQSVRNNEIKVTLKNKLLKKKYNSGFFLYPHSEKIR